MTFGFFEEVRHTYRVVMLETLIYGICLTYLKCCDLLIGNAANYRVVKTILRCSTYSDTLSHNMYFTYCR